MSLYDLNKDAIQTLKDSGQFDNDQIALISGVYDSAIVKAYELGQSYRATGRSRLIDALDGLIDTDRELKGGR